MYRRASAGLLGVHGSYDVALMGEVYTGVQEGRLANASLHGTHGVHAVRPTGEACVCWHGAHRFAWFPKQR